MKIKQIREYGSCVECGINQSRVKGIRILELEFGSSHIQTVQLCEKCFKQLKDLRKEVYRQDIMRRYCSREI